MELQQQENINELTASQRAKRKYYLKNKEHLQKIKTEWNKNAYHNNPEYKLMAKKSSNTYYHAHKEEIRAKSREKKLNNLTKITA